MKVNVEFQEPDKKKWIKRVIAREGLIVLGIILIGIAIVLINNVRNDIFQRNYQLPLLEKPIRVSELPTIPSAPYYKQINNFGDLTLLFGYPFYILIRFVIWAVRTMRDK
jgi:hypothetical protein